MGKKITVQFDGLLIDCEILKERFLWQIYQPFRCLWEQGDKQGEILIPAGFVTNFASVPRPFWSILAPWDGHIRKMAVVHDRLYETHEYSRAFADELLFYGMIPLGAWDIQRWAAWAAVRAGGAWAYRTGPTRQTKRAIIAAVADTAPEQISAVCDELNLEEKTYQ